eukprot:g21246.t1
MKCFALDENRNLIPGLPHPTTQEGIFPLLISKCSEDLLALKDHAGTLLFELQELEQKADAKAWGQETRNIFGRCVRLKRKHLIQISSPVIGILRARTQLLLLFG